MSEPKVTRRKLSDQLDWMLEDNDGSDLPKEAREIVAIARYVTSNVRTGDSEVVIRAIVDVLYLSKKPPQNGVG